MKKLSLLFICTLLSLTAVAQDAPLWVTDRTARFPDSRFVSALGSGQSVREAKTDAASQIAFYFNAHVQAKNETYRDSVNHKNTHALFEGETDYAAFIGYANSEIELFRKEVLGGKKGKAKADSAGKDGYSK